MQHNTNEITLQFCVMLYRQNPISSEIYLAAAHFARDSVRSEFKSAVKADVAPILLPVASDLIRRRCENSIHVITAKGGADIRKSYVLPKRVSLGENLCRSDS